MCEGQRDDGGRHQSCDSSSCDDKSFLFFLLPPSKSLSLLGRSSCAAPRHGCVRVYQETNFSESCVVQQGRIYVFTVFVLHFHTSAVNSDPFHQSSVYIYFCPDTTSVTNNRRLQYQCWNSVNRAAQLRASALSSHVDTQGHNRHFEDFFLF